MNMKALSLSALALSIALSHAAFAHDICEHKHDWIVKVSEKLGLNAEQKTKIKAFSEQVKMDVKAKHEEIRTIHMHVNEAFANNTIDQTKADEFANQEQQTIGAILKLRLKERYDAYMVLDDKQKEKMNKMVKEWSNTHKHVCDSQ